MGKLINFEAPLVFPTLESFFAYGVSDSDAWRVTIDGGDYVGLGDDGMQRLLWSGLRVPVPEIPDSLITLTVGDASQVTRDGSDNLVLSVDGTNASLDEVEVSFDLIYKPIRFPGSVGAQVRVTAGTPATSNRFGVRVSDGTLWMESSLQKAASGYERDMYDSLGTAVTAVALSTPDVTTTDCRQILTLVPRFPQRVQGNGNTLVLDAYGNNTTMAIVPASNNWDLQAGTTSTVAGVRLYASAVAAGSGTISFTVKYLACRIAEGLNDSWN